MVAFPVTEMCALPCTRMVLLPPNRKVVSDKSEDTVQIAEPARSKTPLLTTVLHADCADAVMQHISAKIKRVTRMMNSDLF